ncbi:MAG: hypothetical protein AAF250_00110 [Pseudomonadota bacterium]
MFDNLSDRLGGVFDKLKGFRAFPTKVETTFVVRKSDRQIIAADTGGDAYRV